MSITNQLFEEFVVGPGFKTSAHRL